MSNLVELKCFEVFWNFSLSWVCLMLAGTYWILRLSKLLFLVKTKFRKGELIAGILCVISDFEVILKKNLVVHLKNQHGDI